MRHLDPRLSKLLAERMVAEAQARPRKRPAVHLHLELKGRLGHWMIAVGERLTRRDVEVA